MMSAVTTLSNLKTLVARESTGSWGHFADVPGINSTVHIRSVASSGPVGLCCSHRRHSSGNLSTSMVWVEESEDERVMEAVTSEEEEGQQQQQEQQQQRRRQKVDEAWSMDSYTESENEEDEGFIEVDDEEAWDYLFEEEEEEEEEEDDDDEDSRSTFESKYESIENDSAHFKTNNKASIAIIHNQASLATAVHLVPSSYFDHSAEEELVVEEVEMKESLSFTLPQGITFSFS